MTDGAFIAVDWGTTNRRAWRVEGGAVAAVHRDDRGVATLGRDDYPAQVRALRARLGDHPVLAAGMVGSTRGWREAPYLDCPAGIGDVAAALLDMGDGVRIVPGVARRDDGAPDVMRGEEVQLLGAVAAGLAPPDALMVQPGTHSKWAWLRGGRIDRFATAMTGELFALLGRHSVLADMMRAPVDAASPAFADGVARGAEGRGLTDALFGVRAAVLLDRLSPSEGASRTSGLLIGAELGARDVARAGTVHVVADGALGTLYAAAIGRLGGRPVAVDGAAAFVAGICMIGELGR